MAETAKLKLRLDADGTGTVDLDGVDISDVVTAIEFNADTMAGVTEVKLTIRADVDAGIESKIEHIEIARPDQGLRLLNGQHLKRRPR